MPGDKAGAQGAGAQGSDPARQRLLVAARELLAEVPITGITVRMIAERAGVGHALITRYYGSRARLLTIAIGMTLVDLAADIADAPDAHAAIRRAFDRVLGSRELTAAINVVVLETEEVEEREGFPIVEALTAHLEAAGAPPAAARRTAATLTLMIFAWAGAEARWLRMSGHADDPTTGRYEFQQTLLALADRAAEQVRGAGTPGER